MLLSKMPWYTVQYSSPVPSIKFIKEEWHFDNKPIDIIMMNPQGTVENKKALHLIQRRRGMTAFPFTRRVQTPYVFSSNAPGPYAVKKYTLFYGGEDKKWIEQFSSSAKVVVDHPVIQTALTKIDLYPFEKSSKWTGLLKKKSKIPLLSFENETKWAVLTKGSTREVIDHGVTILNVLEEFEKWKVDVQKRGFENCFKEYHAELLRTCLPPET